MFSLLALAAYATCAKMSFIGLAYAGGASTGYKV